jgi:hypothetical protein
MRIIFSLALLGNAGCSDDKNPPISPAMTLAVDSLNDTGGPTFNSDCPPLELEDGYGVKSVDFSWGAWPSGVEGLRMYSSPVVCFTMPPELDALVISVELPDVADDPTLDWWAYFSDLSVDGDSLVKMDAYGGYPLPVPFGTAWDGPAGWPSRGMTSIGLPFSPSAPSISGAEIEIRAEGWEIPAWLEVGGDMKGARGRIHFGATTHARAERHHTLTLNVFIDPSLLTGGTEYGEDLGSGMIVEEHLTSIIDTFNDIFRGEPDLKMGVVGILSGGFAEVSDIGRLTSNASPEAEAQSLNMFLIESISGGSGLDVSTLGRTGGRPGAALPGNVSGYLYNGVAVAAGSHRSESGAIHPFMSNTAAHEVGHYLGLFHTSEVGGEYHDPLADTPECTTDFTYDSDTWVDDCDESTYQNLMWPVSSGAYDVTDDQLWVASSHPLVK